MKNIHMLKGSPGEVAAQLEKSYERMVNTTQKWIEVLNFEPPPETGLTPRDIVWRKNKARLYRYVNHHCYQHKTPVLLLYALINKAYILDLTPGMSLVEHLVEKGFDVYLLDWGNFDWEDRNLSFKEFIDNYIARAIRKVCRTSETDSLSIIGYCMGGTMTAMYAALYPHPIIKNIIFLAAPIDFSGAGTSSIWLESSVFDVDNITDTFVLIPREFIDGGVKLLNPINNFVSTYTRLWKSLDEDLPISSWKALDKWVNDNVNMPGTTYRQWIKYFYQQNLLIKDGIVLGDKIVHLGKIKANILALTGDKDHIVLPHQSKAIMEYVSSVDRNFKLYRVGHGGLVFGSIAKNEVFPDIADWLGQRS